MKNIQKFESVMEEIKIIVDQTEFDGKNIDKYKESVIKKIEEVFKKSVIIDKKISESAKQI